MLSAHPVPDRTLYAVHLARVLFHLCAYVAAYVPMPMVLGVLVYPAWAVLLLFPLISLLSAVTSLAFVAVVYGVLLRVVGSAHFRRAALLLQIGSLVLFIGGMQVAMHSRELHELLGTLQDRPAWMLALPPAHSAGLFQLALGDAARQTQVLAALALVVPVIALLCALGLVSGRFLKGQAGEMAPVGGGGTWRRSPLARFGLPQSRGGSGERAGFVLGQALSRREPGLLAGALPGMIGMQVMGLVMGWRGMGDLSIPPAAVAALTGGLLASQLPFVLDLAQRSAHGEAAWLLRMSPLKAEQKILVGGVQGVLWGLYVPVILLGVLALTLGFGLGALPQVVLGYAASVLLGLVFVRRLELAIPFTLPSRGKHRSSGDVLIAMILNGLCVMPLAGVCGILALDPIATWVGLALVLPLLVRGYRRLREMQPRGLRSVRVPQARREVWS